MTAEINPTDADWNRMRAGGTKLAYKLTLYDSVADKFNAKEGFHLCKVVRAGNAVEIMVICSEDK